MLRDSSIGFGILLNLMKIYFKYKYLKTSPMAVKITKLGIPGENINPTKINKTKFA